MPRINPTSHVLVGKPAETEIHSDKRETFVSKQNQMVLHNITILDCSTSMHGIKWTNAVKGVKLDYENCKKEGFKSYTLVRFACHSNIKTTTLDFSTDIDCGLPYGNTALYDAIGIALTNGFKTLTGKVLVKIFTDGQENDSRKYTASQVELLIKQAEEKGYTVTFVGTENDVAFVQAKLAIDSSNTAVHDNTGAGVEQVFRSYAQSTSEYTKAIARGESVSRGFFHKSIKNK